MTLSEYKPLLSFGVLVVDRIVPPTFSYDPEVGIFDLERNLNKTEEKTLLEEIAYAYRRYLQTAAQECSPLARS